MRIRHFIAASLAITIAAGVLLLAPSAAAVANAMPPDDPASQRQERQETVKHRLETAKLRICKARESNIDHAMARLSTRGQKQLNLFSQIAERTEHFYTEKGKTLSNYDTLVS